MNAVTISGTSWVTYIAYSNTANSATNKEMVAIYYQGGVYKKFLLEKWFTVEHPAGMKYYNKIKVPENYSVSKPFNNSFIVIPSQNQVTGITHVYPPSACGITVVKMCRKFLHRSWLA